MRKRTSVMWQMPSEKFKKLVEKSNSLSQIIKHFGFVTSVGNYGTLKKRLKEENIDYSHIKMGRDSNKGRQFLKTAKPLEEVMVENSTYCRGSLKKRLLKAGILENKCEICGQEEIWNDIKLVMVLDHINGIRNDHRRENLRMLCPNCNSQQKTFSGRNGKKRYNCIECKKEITKHSKSKLCRSCVGAKFQNRKIKDRPSREQLLKEIEETNYCAVGRKYSVSDNAIRKWIK